MKKQRMLSMATVFGLCIVLFCGQASGNAKGAEKIYDISMDDNVIHLDAGILHRTITLNGVNVSTSSLTVAGQELLAEPAKETSFVIHYAEPNARPRGIKPGASVAGVEAAENVSAEITDALIVKKGEGYEWIRLK